MKKQNANNRSLYRSIKILGVLLLVWLSLPDFAFWSRSSGTVPRRYRNLYKEYLQVPKNQVPQGPPNWVRILPGNMAGWWWCQEPWNGLYMTFQSCWEWKIIPTDELTPSFFRGVGLKPPARIWLTIMNHIFTIYSPYIHHIFTIYSPYINHNGRLKPPTSHWFCGCWRSSAFCVPSEVRQYHQWLDDCCVSVSRRAGIVHWGAWWPGKIFFFGEGN